MGCDGDWESKCPHPAKEHNPEGRGARAVVISERRARAHALGTDAAVASRLPPERSREGG